MNVFLIGFMGSGKSTIGKRLARRLNYRFLDLDAELEVIENRSVQAIFEEDGEDYFRALEHHWLVNMNLDETIISLGGGTPCFHNNMSLVNQKGKSVYLSLDTKALTHRLVNSKTRRPLIEQYKDTPGVLLTKIEDMMTFRSPFYEKADLIFEAGNMTTLKYDLLSEQVKRLMGQ